MDSSGKPVVLSSVTITRAGSGTLVQTGRTETGGVYRFSNVPSGEYDLTIKPSWFYEATIKAVRLGAEELRVVPTIQLETTPMCDVSNDSRPQHYRLSNGPIGTGALSGIILDERGNPVVSATLVLYRQGSGSLSTTKSDETGRFSFNGLRPGTQYWISVSADRYFADGLTGLAVQSGLDAVHTKTLESCAPGHCQPHLKSQRILGGCA